MQKKKKAFVWTTSYIYWVKLYKQSLQNKNKKHPVNWLQDYLKQNVHNISYY